MLGAAALGATALLAAGCGVERTMQVRSDPPGALVYLNGEEAGRTPMRKMFLWYGTYDLEVRKDGYLTRSERPRVWAPWWQVPPIDLIAELVPLRLQDNHVLNYRLDPVTEKQTDPEKVLERAAETRKKLRSSDNTRQPQG